MTLIRISIQLAVLVLHAATLPRIMEKLECSDQCPTDRAQYSPKFSFLMLNFPLSNRQILQVTVICEESLCLSITAEKKGDKVYTAMPKGRIRDYRFLSSVDLILVQTLQSRDMQSRQ